MNTQQPKEGTDLVPTTLIDQDPVTGRFLPGNQLGFKRSGSLNKITKMMREQLAERLEEAGPKGNPLVAMHDIMVDLELPAALRLHAAFRLAQFLAPRLLSVEMEPVDSEFQVETEKITERLKAYFSVKEVDREAA